MKKNIFRLSIAIGIVFVALTVFTNNTNTQSSDINLLEMNKIAVANAELPPIGQACNGGCASGDPYDMCFWCYRCYPQFMETPIGYIDRC